MRKHLVRFTLFLVCLAIGLGFVYSQGYLVEAWDKVVSSFTSNKTEEVVVSQKDLKHEPKHEGKFNSDNLSADIAFLENVENASKFYSWSSTGSYLIAKTKSLNLPNEKLEKHYRYHLSRQDSGIYGLYISEEIYNRDNNSFQSYDAKDLDLDGGVDTNDKFEDKVKLQKIFDSGLDILHQLKQEQ